MKKVVYLAALGRAYARAGLEAWPDILSLAGSVNSSSGALGWKASVVARPAELRVFTSTGEAMPAPELAPSWMFARGLKDLKGRLDLNGRIRSYRRELEEAAGELGTADIFHAWDTASVLALRGLDIPVLRSKPLLFTPEPGDSSSGPSWLCSLRRAALKTSDALVLPGNWACSELAAGDKDPGKYLILPRGLEDTKPLRKGRIRFGLGAKGKDIVVCSFGRLAPENGFEVLIDAMVLAVRKMPENLFCAIAGAGPEEQRLKQRIRKAGLEARVKLIGFRQDAGELLADSDIFAAPSAGTVPDHGLLEAMRAGIAITASDGGGNSEAIGWGQAGALVPPGNPEALARSITNIASDPAELGYLSVRARAYFVKHHTLKALAASAAGLYNKTLEGK